MALRLPVRLTTSHNGPLTSTARSIGLAPSGNRRPSATTSAHPRAPSPARRWSLPPVRPSRHRSDCPACAPAARPPAPANRRGRRMDWATSGCCCPPPPPARPDRGPCIPPRRGYRQVAPVKTLHQPRRPGGFAGQSIWIPPTTPPAAADEPAQLIRHPAVPLPALAKPRPVQGCAHERRTGQC